MFDSSYVLRIATFLEAPSFEVVFVFVIERVAVIHSLKDNVFIFTGDLAVIHCLSSSFSNSMFIYFGIKTFPERYINRCYLQKELCVTIRDFIKALVAIM